MPNHSGRGEPRPRNNYKRGGNLVKAIVLWASMLIWAVVILASSLTEPEAFPNLVLILGGGAAFHLILLGSQIRKQK